MPGVILKVGKPDDTAVFVALPMAIFAIDKHPFHRIAEEMATFERLPQR